MTGTLKSGLRGAVAGAVYCAVFVLLVPSGKGAHPEGERIYRQLCADCHGAKGEGVKGKCDDPLVGDESLSRLAKIIEKTMPEKAPEKCHGEDAQKVAAYIYSTFYSKAARAKQQKARIELARLTIPQYRQTVADLFASFIGQPRIDDQRGLQATYYNARNFSDKKRVFRRTDARVAFDFKDEAPEGGKFDKEQFSIRWDGAVIADETGFYEFGLKTENGAQLWVNDMETPLIDGYVATGDREMVQRQRIFLLGGRAYPLRLEYFKYKGKTASIELRWKAPYQVEEVIPRRSLQPRSVPPSMIVDTAFPPDDRSVGYERGVNVSKEWDAAATFAALEIMTKAVRNLNRLSNSRSTDPQRMQKVKEFCRKFSERAFRRPLNEEQKQFFIEKQFAGAKDPEGAVKRVCLLVLKSPRFLYPVLVAGRVDDYVIAERLAFGLWDSMPDETLFRAAQSGQLRKPEQVAAQARRMLDDPRTRSKLRSFFHHWLHTTEAEDIAKDAKLFPGFDERVIADLRTSLNLFLDDVVWRGGGDYRELLQANHLFLNRWLAKFYPAEVPDEDGFHKVSFDAKERAGVMTHPYLLSIFAYRQASSPIHRGVFVTRNVLGRTLKPPPAATEFKDSNFDPKMTMREKVSELTRPAACQTCHSVINPLGFSLEQYDAIGRFRTSEKDQPIDPTGEYVTTDGKKVHLTGARDLATYAANDIEPQRSFVEKLFHETVKQPMGAYGGETAGRLHEAFRKNNFDIRKLLVEIASVSALHGVAESN